MNRDRFKSEMEWWAKRRPGENVYQAENFAAHDKTAAILLKDIIDAQDALTVYAKLRTGEK